MTWSFVFSNFLAYSRKYFFDGGCAFQKLEHLLYDIAVQAFKELVRVSRNSVIISLPDAKMVWRYSADIPKLG